MHILAPKGTSFHHGSPQHAHILLSVCQCAMPRFRHGHTLLGFSAVSEAEATSLYFCTPHRLGVAAECPNHPWYQNNSPCHNLEPSNPEFDQVQQQDASPLAQRPGPAHRDSSPVETQ
jgi:hypothetical protein